MTGVSFELTGAEEALAKLGTAADRMDHALPLFDAIGAMLVTSTQQRFETETDPSGTPWPASLRAKTDGGKTLTDSAHLRNSMTHEPDDTGVMVGTNVIYAAIHQLGGVIRAKSAEFLHFISGGEDVFVKSVTMPQRAFLGLDDADEKEIEAIAGDFVLAPFTDTGAAGSTSGGSFAPRSGPGQPLGGP